MAQVAFVNNIGSEWVDLTALTTLTEDEVYYIQNRGAGVLLAQENNAEPTDEGGTVIMPYKVLKYTNNGKCWVKSLSGLCTVNITDKNAPEPAVETKWYNLMGFWVGEGMAGGYKVYDSDWQPLSDMTEMQTIIAGGGTVAGAGFGFTDGDTQNIEVHVVSNISDDQTELDGEKSLWIVVTENGNKVNILAEDATLTLSEDFLTLSWSYDTYAGTFTADMSDMNKPLLECGSVTHNGQSCENAELIVKFIPQGE